jgi:hypothetical protein
VKPSTFTVKRKVNARIVGTHFSKYRRDTRQQVDFTASHISMALPHILSSRPSAFMESVKISLWLRHFCGHVIVRKGVHHWVAEYIHLGCVQRLQSARMKNFCRPTQSFCFVVFCFMADYAHTYLLGLLAKDSCIRIVVPTLRSRSVIFLL